MQSRLKLLPFLLLVFTLLFTQQGAAIHALSHLGEFLPSHSQSDKQLPHSSACDECVVYAGVGTAVAASSLLIPAVGVQRRHIATSHPLLQFQSVRLYHARAPPTSSE